MPTDTTEKGLETIITESLINNSGYRKTISDDYDRDLCLCLCPAILMEFIKDTQLAAYTSIRKRGEEKFIKRVSE